VVAAVVGGEQVIGLRRVADDGIEVGRVLIACGCCANPSISNPGVDGLAVGFAQGTGVVEGGADLGRDGGSDDAERVGVGDG